MALRLVQFLAVILTALSLVPVGAHFFELPNKIDLARDQYFAVQGIYRGWALFGAVLIAAIAINLLLAILLRGRRAFWLALCAFILMACTLAIFFAWTYPTNQATANWTMVPAEWREMRRQWEYSHATNAVLTFLALCSVTLSVISAREAR